MSEERLQKFLARAGVASRRRAEALIEAGRVEVNDRKVVELGVKVTPGVDVVKVDGRLIELPDTFGYALLYKPHGMVTTLSDPEQRPHVGQLVKDGRRLFPVGRLDFDAEGALLLTDDGELAHRLTHPSFGVRRTYLAKVKGAPDEATLEKLRGGVLLEDGPAQPLRAEVFKSAVRNTWLLLVVGEGRNHLVKRMCAAIGHPVTRLFRPFQAALSVRGMQPGELRPLQAEEVATLHSVSRGEPVPEPEPYLPARREGRGEAEPADDADD